MTKFLVKSFFLISVLLLGGSTRSHIHSVQLATNLSDISELEENAQKEELSDDESIDLPSPSHGNGKDLCLPVFERAEEQELEYKSLKKKLDGGFDGHAMTCILPIHSAFFINNNLSSHEWRNLFTTTAPRYLVLRNLRS
jgi:hypothetical protein